MHKYPFNWSEFHKWKKEQENEVQDKNSVGFYVFNLHGLPVWPTVRVPSDKGSRTAWPKRAGACIFALLACYWMPAQAAEYQITDAIRIEFGATVVNSARVEVVDGKLVVSEDHGCVLNEEKQEVEC